MASQYALSTAPAPCVSCHAKNETFFSRSNRCSYFLSACKRKCTSHTKTTFSYSKLTCKKTWRIYAVSEGSLIAQPSKAVMISLEGAKIIDLNGNEVQVVDLWKDRKVVIGFARHFGCVLCRKRADLLASQKSQMDLAGVTLALVGPGSLDQAKAFVDQTKFPGEVYADPHHSAYDALKFVSGISSTFTPSAARKIFQLYREGYRQDWGLSFQKDTVNRGGWQQGGIIVAGPGKYNILYLHKDKEAGDEPDIADVMKACCISNS
eukprot:TRINITY_DN2627_c0_g1_i1.p1 TRINITY_DN2627_c0_g1~~TRINITY_DN2627_c0_g1_i1.p1  ORF type:complete len:264 (+),score=47.94 TRINITY_DN2627_c0_g1_i1:186-977(+)